MIIECESDEASALLDPAKQHCPEAVTDIDYGLKLSQNFALIS